MSICKSSLTEAPRILSQLQKQHKKRLFKVVLLVSKGNDVI